MAEAGGGLRPDTGAREPDTSGDTRATAVLAVLAGVSTDNVAARFGVSEEVLAGWVRVFVEAGREGVTDSEPEQQHRDRYLSLISHELRSPLTMIQGWADLLEDADASDAEVLARAAAGINAQVDRLMRLADDVLDATGVALGQLTLDRRPVMLGAVLSDIIAARSQENPVVVVDCDVEVLLDVDRFGQVVDNLLENARKHATGDAVVTVRRRGEQAEIVISSEGSPIDPVLARRMFEPFQRGSSSGEGIGLGLYVCRSLVVAHGGQIGVHVDTDGNHFWLRLPIHSDDEAPSA